MLKIDFFLIAWNTWELKSNGIEIVSFYKKLQKSQSCWELRPQTSFCDMFEILLLVINSSFTSGNASVVHITQKFQLFKSFRILSGITVLNTSRLS